MKSLLVFIFAVVFAINAHAAPLFVNEDELVSAIKSDAMEQGFEEAIDLEFFGGQTNFHIENAQKSKIMISNLKFDEMQNKFSCQAEIFADGNPYAVTQIQGKYYVLGEAWVPAKNISKGETLQEDMLKTINVRMNRIKPINIIEKDKIVGKQAKKSLKEGKIIGDRDIGKVTIVKKGDLLSAIYKTDKMQITVKVEALRDGSKGDKIEVINTVSKKNLAGIIIDANTIEIVVQ